MTSGLCQLLALESRGVKLACFGPEFSPRVPFPWGIRTLLVKLRGLGDINFGRSRCLLTTYTPVSDRATHLFRHLLETLERQAGSCASAGANLWRGFWNPHPALHIIMGRK